MDWTQFLTVIGALGGLVTGIAALVTSLAQQRKVSAERMKLLDDINDQVLERTRKFTAETVEQNIKLSNRIQTLETQFRAQDDLIMIAIGYIKALTAQMASAGVVPEKEQPPELTEWLKQYRRRRDERTL